MTHTLLKMISLVLALISVVIVPAVLSSGAEAHELQHPLVHNISVNGSFDTQSSQIGQTYCDAVRIPNRVCDLYPTGTQSCTIKGWTVRQTCF